MNKLKSQRVRRSDEDLIKASDHLYYEYAMFEQVVFKLDHRLQMEVYERNAFLESFLIHFRNLYDFLVPIDPQINDIIAQDFFDDPVSWKNMKLSWSKKVKDYRLSINKKISHLTYERIKPEIEEKEWPPIEFLKVVRKRMRFFLLKAPDSRFCIDLKELKNRYIRDGLGLRTVSVLENSEPSPLAEPD